ncbi:MAG TPA: helix-turn-helix transcriptional regulator [Flavobacteriales bacterium]|nr:helix-turn-helix transcriptional regulator [Flavobacteriales bacterium]
MKEKLSAREVQVMECLQKGMSNDEIARKLSLSVTTVKTHLRRIFIKLNADSRLQAVYKYQSNTKK